MQEIFRKYDIRGIVGKQFTVEDSYQIAMAIVTYLNLKSPNLKKIAIGMDGRLHSQAIKEQVCNAITSLDFDVYFVGSCTSPALYFACYTMDVDAGIMITASHNPKEYNGFKILLNKKFLWDNDISEIYKILKTKQFVSTQGIGTYFEENIIDKYVDWLADHFNHLIGKNFNFIIDCGNGAAGTVMPKLLQKFNWPNVKLLYPEVDGNYPNHNPNPMEIKNMLDVQKQLNENPNLEFGCGLDGDADRFSAMTKTGYLIPGDILLGVYALNMQNSKVVMDVKCSNALSQTLQKKEIPYFVSPTGNAYIKNYMAKHNANVGGELSGHFCFKDRHFGYDDGIYAMLRFCEITYQTNKTADELIDEFPSTYSSPEIRISCQETEKNTIIQNTAAACIKWDGAKIIDVDGMRVETDHGWAIVRAANTEPAISIRIEGNSNKALLDLKTNLFTILSQYLDNEQLRNKFEL